MHARFLLPILLAAAPASAQNPDALPFTLELVEVDVTAMPGLHSFAWAEHDGKWLFVTGRVDGLHPIVTVVEPDVFPAEQANHDVWVVDVTAEQVWARPLSELPDDVADPLRVTNAQYHQEGGTLYVVGGYGLDSATGEKITFPTLTAIDVPGMIEAVTTGGALAPHLRQTEAEFLAVTGGELRHRVGGEYLLFGGQRFDGEYTFPEEDFTQVYTDRILFLNIDDDGAALGVDEGFEIVDPEVLHRRDMTVAPTYVRYLPVEAEHPDDTVIGPGYALYAGVFRRDADLPFRTQVYHFWSDIPEYAESTYEQQFAHYTCPALPMWDSEAEAMHTTFFGGMAEFVFDEATGAVERDPLVPFTDDIVTLTNVLDAEAPATFETVMPARMPGLLGANAVLIPAAGVPSSAHGVLDLREVQGRTLVGHIVGGIESEAPNPGWMGMATSQTNASSRLFEVYVTPTFDVATEPSAAPLSLTLEAPYPNPFRTEATVAFVLDRPADVVVEVFDAMGRRVAVLHEGPLGVQRHAFSFRAGDLPAGVYYARVHGDGFGETRPLVRVR